MRINLASMRLAFFLIAALVLMVVLSAVIPQEDFASARIIDWEKTLGSGYAVVEWLGLNQIYYTPTFFIVLGLLAVNLTVANVKRIRSVTRAKRAGSRLRLAGSILFHLALLLVMFGAILHFLFKYEGVLSLTEGQTVRDRQEEYLREFSGPLSVPSYDEFSLTLNEIGHTEGEIDPLGSKALVTLEPSEGGPIQAEISTNHPLQWDNYEFHFGSTVGYSPELHLWDSSGQTLFRSFVRVKRHEEEGAYRHFDFVIIDSADLKLDLEIVSAEGAEERPQYRIAVTGIDSSLFDGVISATDTVHFDQFRLAVPRLRYWCYIGAIRNPYLNLIFTGFWLSLIGLGLSLVGRVAPHRS